MSVEVPEQKRIKYLKELESWDTQSTHDARQVSKIYGQLLHVSLVLTRGKAYLIELEKFAADLDHEPPLTKHRPPRRWPVDAKWWREALANPISAPIPGPIDLIDIQAFSDASRWQGTNGKERDIGGPLLTMHTKYGVTTKVSLRAGGMEEVETDPLMIYSKAFITSLNDNVSKSIPATSWQVDTIPQISTPEVPLDPLISYSHVSQSPPISRTLLPTMTLPSQQPNFAAQAVTRALLLNVLPDPSKINNKPTNSGPLRKRLDSSRSFRTPAGSRPPTSIYPHPTPLPTATQSSFSQVRAYPSNLQIAPSALRPHCAAKERLVTWKPARLRIFRDSEGRRMDSVDSELASWVQCVMSYGFAESTLGSYAAGLLSFHVFCDSRNVEEEQRAPCSSDLLTSWIATMAGSFAGTLVKNYVNGLRAWHLIHRVEWNINQAELSTIMAGAERLQPDKSRQKKRQPFTVSYISKILADLNPADSLDAACRACLTTSFYCVARLGELTVPTIKDFRAEDHVTTANVKTGQDRNGFTTQIIHVPHTKSNPLEGEDIYFSKQLDSTDPDSVLNHHLQFNMPSPHEHLFTYSSKSSKGSVRKPLTKSTFVARIHKAAKRQGLELLQGHGIRIGATLEYLLRGVPFDAIRVLGRWKSDAFLTYLRKHAEIMVPYLQPEIHQALIRYAMPPVRCKCPPPVVGIHGRWMHRALLHLWESQLTVLCIPFFHRVSSTSGPRTLRVLTQDPSSY
ncbi:hypothetical protein D9757_015269 [Collybiopsis confluens]|uniref:Tyr recombinase domain-containing protein n=1 Tax=Collybiopsis confluens TaxID=2823264 RepID=A0A8H5CLV2_9AGAR|nr:hypothetical protein D9757_015269 [Collybiopsis confluens]